MATAVRRSWSAASCDPADLPMWTPANPSRGQCGTTALVLNDLLGGQLALAVVLWPDGSRQGYHYWNVLPDGREVDLTREQFAGEQVILTKPTIASRPAGPPTRCQNQYAALQNAVFMRLARYKPIRVSTQIGWSSRNVGGAS